MPKKFCTVFVGGGVGNIFAVSEMVKNLIGIAQKSQFTLPKQKLIIIDRMGNFGGGIPWGKDAHLSFFFNSPHRLNEPKEAFKEWIFNNIDQVITYIQQKGGKVGFEWLIRNQKKLSAQQIDEVYFPRRIYGFFMEDKLYKTLNAAATALVQNNLDIEIQLIEATVEKINLNPDRTKQIILKNNLGYEIKGIPNSQSHQLPQIFFNRINQISELPHANSVCISIGTLPNPSLSVNSGNPNYISTLYEGDQINYLKQQILQVYQQQHRKVCIVFLGSSATFLDPLLEIESDVDIADIITIISISREGKTRQPAIILNNLDSYSPQFIINDFKRIDDLIYALKQEYKSGEQKGYNPYSIWYNCIALFQEKLTYFKDNYPEEFNKYLKTGFMEVRKLTNFTNPDTIAAKERLEKNSILFLQKADFTNGFSIEEQDNQFIIKLNSLEHNSRILVADILVNAMGEDKFTNFIPFSSLIQSLIQCGAEINESENGFKTDNNQQASEGIYIIGKLAFGSNLANLEFSLRYTHLKAIFNQGLRVGKALTLAVINST